MRSRIRRRRSRSSRRRTRPTTTSCARRAREVGFDLAVRGNKLYFQPPVDSSTAPAVGTLQTDDSLTLDVRRQPELVLAAHHRRRAGGAGRGARLGSRTSSRRCSATAEGVHDERRRRERRPLAGLRRRRCSASDVEVRGRRSSADATTDDVAARRQRGRRADRLGLRRGRGHRRRRSAAARGRGCQRRGRRPPVRGEVHDHRLAPRDRRGRVPHATSPSPAARSARCSGSRASARRPATTRRAARRSTAS